MKTTGSQRQKNPCNEREHRPIQRRILNEIRELEQLDQFNPLEDRNSRKQSLSNFDWTDSTPQPDAKQAVEDLLIEFYDFFARIASTLDLTQSSKYDLHL